MLLSGNRLKKSSGKIIKFSSAQKRRNWERVALAYKHGWRPKTSEILHVPIISWTVEITKKFLRDTKVIKQSFETKSNADFRAVLDKIRTALAETDTSNKDWSAVDKSKLPAACFLWVEDVEKKSSWHLPYREGAGDINPDTGMYSKAGPINANAVRAIMSALGGAHTGKPMSVPEEVKTKAEALAKQLKIGQYAKEELEDVTEEQMDEMFSTYQELDRMFEQMFMSLQSRMYDAVRATYKDQYYLSDWSEDSVLLRPSEKASPGMAVADNEIYYQVDYSIDDNGDIIFEGEPMKVRRITTYVPVE
jgi:hypothetical protein